MGLITSHVGFLNIPSGTKNSDVLVLKSMRLARRIIIKTDAINGVVTLKGSLNHSDTFNGCVPVVVGGAAVVLVASSINYIEAGGLAEICVVCADDQGADRELDVWVAEDTN